MKFGEYLKERREARGWTQPEAAARAGVEQSYLSKLETGRSIPSEEVFARLAQTYEINPAELARAVSSADLERLREIGEVRAAILANGRSRRRIARGWMLAALAFLMIGGACLGLSAVPFERQEAEYRYVSLGILGPDEPVDAFDVVFDQLDPAMYDYEERNFRRTAMTERLDPVTVVHASERGGVYLETVAGGRRRFDLNGQEVRNLASPLRWFLIPALMFLIAGPAAFLIALRWSQTI